jgi:hypothetical protein
MMDKKDADSWMVPALKRVKGIVEASPFSSEDHQEIIDLEQDAENRSLMGLGKVVNTGVREVLNCDLLYVALNNMDFDWGCHATLVLIKNDEVVGEEVRDEAVIAGLRNKKNVWFMHKNFVVYKDKITFPQDIMKKICHFEIPWLPAEWCTVENDTFRCHSIIYANPCTPSDVFLKDQYFSGLDERGLGTILVGVKL